MTRSARFQVSGDLLREVLHLPPLTRFIAASVDPANRWDLVTFVVEDPELPDADEPHDTNPTITRVEHVWDWNIE